MGTFTRLVDHVTAMPAGTSDLDAGAGIDGVLARAAASPDVERLVRAVAKEQRSFQFGVLVIHPRSFTRTHPELILGPTELPIGGDGSGDLYVVDAASGRARHVRHDEGWRTRGEWPDLDRMIADLVWRSLESIEPDEVPELSEQGEEQLRALRFALEIQPDALQDETRDALREAGLLP